MMRPLPQTMVQVPDHHSTLAWVDALVSDLALRLVQKPPKSEITVQRLHFWRTLEAELEKCTDPALEIMGLKPIMDPLPVPRHREAMNYIDRLVLDVKLQLLGFPPIHEISPARLDEWAQTHRPDVERCRRRGRPESGVWR